MTTKKITLEILKYASVGILPGQTMIDSLTYEELWDARLKQMLASIRTKVLAHNFENHSHTVTISHDFSLPASWWQMLKRDHFPQWFINRFPVVSRNETKTSKRTVNFKKYATYPSANIALPPQTFSFPVYTTQISEAEEYPHD